MNITTRVKEGYLILQLTKSDIRYCRSLICCCTSLLRYCRFLLCCRSSTREEPPSSLLLIILPSLELSSEPDDILSTSFLSLTRSNHFRVFPARTHCCCSVGRKILDSLNAISYHQPKKEDNNGGALELFCEVVEKQYNC